MKTAVECLKQDIDRELKHGTKMIVNWDMYLQMEKQQRGYSEEDMIKFMQFIVSEEELENTSGVSVDTAKYFLNKFKNK